MSSVVIFLFPFFIQFMKKLGSAGQQNATRCGLWWVEMLKIRDQIKEAATVYFRICSEVIFYMLGIALDECILSVTHTLSGFSPLGSFTFGCDA